MINFPFLVKIFNRDDIEEFISSFKFIDDALLFAFDYPRMLYKRLVIVDDLGQYHLEIKNY